MLDEPSNGLDPQGMREMRDLIEPSPTTDRRAGVVAQLSELEQVCDWLVLIDTGRSVYQGPAADFLEDGAALAIAPQRTEDLDALDEGGDRQRPARPAQRRAGDHPAAGRERSDLAAEVNAAAFGAGLVLVEIAPVRDTLEERYLSLVGTASVLESDHYEWSIVMTNVIRAELYRLVRRRTIVIGGAVAVAFSFLAAFAIFAAADSVGHGPRRVARRSPSSPRAVVPRRSPSARASPRFLALVSAIALIGNEFANGTFRSLALREPRRIRLIAGKFIGLAIVLAGILLAAEALTFLTSPPARWQDVPTDAWFSLGGITGAAGDFASTFAGLAGWMVSGPSWRSCSVRSRSRSPSAWPGQGRSRTSPSTRGRRGCGCSPARCCGRSSPEARRNSG